MKTDWDYTDRARYYDKRADYSPEAIGDLLDLARPDPTIPVADIGAGTGKLTKEFLARGLTVLAVEPNDEMRRIGIANTTGGHVTWTEGTGETTGLPDRCVSLAAFGSSFNVVDRQRALVEVARVLVPGGWFVCIWNHRDLDDPVQAGVETVIREHLPGYGYGTRREDQTEVIRASLLFEEPKVLSGAIAHVTSSVDYIEAWRSHATLQRQAGDRFNVLVDAIATRLSGMKAITVPYFTRIWAARLLPS